VLSSRRQGKRKSSHRGIGAPRGRLRPRYDRDRPSDSAIGEARL